MGLNKRFHGRDREARRNALGSAVVAGIAISRRFLIGVLLATLLGMVASDPALAGEPIGADFGDAPDPTYPTLLASTGASHVTGGPLFLGALVDGEADGQPNATATGDDVSGLDDEDGVTFSSLLVGVVGTATVTASSSGLLDAWADFNADGDWLDAGEQIAAGLALAAGANMLPIPASFTGPGTTFARFRLSTAGGLAPTGSAPDGEVEDYELTVFSPGTIIIIKEAIPDDPQDFSFTDDIESPNSFVLDDDGDATLSNTKTFNNVAPGGYSVVELAQAGWTFDDFTAFGSSCDDGNSSFDGPTAFINVESGETVTCTFVNLTEATSNNVTFSKAFNPDTIGPGSVSMLTFTITNSSTSPVTDLTFEDVLPFEITIATPAAVVNTCNGTVTAPDGGSTIVLFDGDVGGSSSCMVMVNVTASLPGEGPYTNTSGNLFSSDGTGGTASDDLTVDTDRLGFSKSFAPSSIPLGDRSTLTFTIDNSLNPSFASLLAFTDNLPTGMEVADPANASTDCNFSSSSVVTAVPGTGVVSLGAGGVAAMSTCTVTLDVIATGAGVLDNVTGELTSRFGFDITTFSSGKAGATLDVTVTPIALTKEFTDDPTPPSGTVTLEFTITNFDRFDSATSIAFTDDLSFLSFMASGLPLADPCGSGSSLSGAMGVLTFSGGNLPPEGSCTFSVVLQLAGATPGVFTNTTGAITADIGASMVTGNMASDDLFVEAVPLLTKEFLDDPVGAGGTTTLRFTLTNTSPTSTLDSIAFVDVFDDVIQTASAGPTSDCGGTATFTPHVNPAPPSSVIPAMLSLSGGSLAAAGSCTIEITLEILPGTAAGTYPNMTSTITGLLGGEEPVEGSPASDNLVVIAAPQLTKAFTNDPVAPGGTVTLEFTLTHSLNATADATGITFTDDLAPVLAGLTATGLPLMEACDPDGPGGNPGTGTLSGSVGDTLLTFMGGALSPGTSCVFSVTLNVPAGAAPGNHTNTTSGVGATVGGFAATSAPATDDLNVQGLTFTKEFIGDPVLPGETVTLRFTIENVHPTDDAADITFTDDLAAVLPATPDLTTSLPATVDTCGGTPGLIGSSLFTYIGGSVLNEQMCAIEIEIVVPAGAADGTYTNTTSGMSSSLGIIDPAVDSLTIDSNLLSLTKEFTDDPVVPGGTVILRFTLTNLSPNEALTDIGFSDDLDAALMGLLATGLPVAGCGGTATTSDGGMTIDFGGGSLAPSGVCSFDVAVAVPSVPIGTLAVNTTSGVTGLTSGDLDVVGTPATDELRIGFLTLTKAFDGPTKAGETVVLTFTLMNMADAAAGDLGFADDLDAVVSGLVATGLPVAACGGTLITPDGGSTIILVGGSLAAAGLPGDSCAFPVTLTVPGEAPFGIFTNTTSDLLQTGVSIGDPAVADLEIEPPIDFSKAFLPDTIGPDSTSQLAFTIANLDAGAPAEDLAFVDNLPPGVVIATPSSASTDCTDGVLSAPDGGTTISLAGARLGTGGTCMVTVNVTAAAAGTYDNETGELTSTAGSGGTASATLTVDAGLPGFSKNFAPNPIPPGGTSTLTFTIDYSAFMGGGLDFIVYGIDNLEFTDTLPTGVVVAALPNATTDCTGGLSPPVITAVAGTDFIALALGFVGAGSICTVEVDVTAAAAGLYKNISGELFSGDSAPVSSGFATAALDVPVAFLIKSFTDDPVPPGGTVTLEFTINNPDRDFAATDIAYTDPIDPLGSLTGLAPGESLPKAACGGMLDFAAGTLTFSGGMLPAGGSCTFSVLLDVPAAAATGTFPNTTTAITATIDGSGVVGNMATDNLVVSDAPLFTKEFVDDPVGAGGTVTLRFTITNTNGASSLTDITFTDDLNTAIAGLAANGLVSGTPPSQILVPLVDVCGLGSELNALVVSSVPFLIADPTMLVLTGGSLAPAGSMGDSCTFDVVLDVPMGVPTGTYTNMTSDVSGLIFGEVPLAGLAATGDLQVIGAPDFSKQFVDDPVVAGDTVTLEFTLTYPAEAPAPATDIQFTDDLVGTTGLPGLAANDLPKSDICGSGSQITGTTNLTLTGGTLAPGETCTFSVTLDVPVAASPGVYLNETSNVVATVSGMTTIGDPATAELVVGGLTLTKEFTDDPVIAGATVTLQFVLTNQTTEDFVDIFFNDDLNAALAGLTAIGLPLSNACDPDPMDASPGTGILTGTTSLNFAGGELLAGESCAFSVTLQVPAGAASGTYVNLTSGFSAAIVEELFLFENARDDLVVANEQLLLTKEFIDDPTVPGGAVTLEFSFSTLGVSESATDLAFTDDLDAALMGLVAVGPFDTSTCGGTLTGTSLLDYSGGSLTGGECSFSVTLQVPVAVPFGTTITNTTSEVTGTIDGLPVTGSPASDDLMIDFFTFTKFFDGLTKPTGTSVLTFTIENLSTMDSITDLAFTDDLDAVIPGLAATGLPANPCGLGSSISGTSLLALSGGNLLPGGSCTFSVDLLVPANAPAGTFLNATSELLIFGVPVASPATALLDVDPPPTLTKIFVPDFIVSGGRSALTFLIENSGAFPVTDIAFVDNLPAGVTIAFSADVGTTCTGGVLTAVEGSGVIAFSGGELPAGGSCLAQVDVTAVIPGSYVNVTEQMTSSSGTSAAAIDTLFVVASGEPCIAPNGEDLVIENDTFLTEMEFVVCNTIAVGPNVGVLGPDGSLILRAGVAVVFLNDVTIGVDGKLTVSIEPLLMP